MQLSLFDRLPEKAQQELLDSVIEDAGGLDGDDADLAEAWRTGNMKAIERATHRGLLAYPDLRAALYSRRNLAWSDRIARLMASGSHPFVAVGAAHMAGSEGLPALLAAKGFKVTRIQ
jgi:uncharacterized protein YbaP (TraB family)